MRMVWDVYLQAPVKVWRLDPLAAAAAVVAAAAAAAVVAALKRIEYNIH